MSDEPNEPEDIEQEEGGDDLCDPEMTLEDDEVTSDEELPEATGGVEE